MRTAQAALAAFPAEVPSLDQHTTRGVEALGKALGLWEKLEPLVSDFAGRLGERLHAAEMDGAEVGDTTRELVTLLGKLSATIANLVNAVDRAARLRSFLCGGPDSRPDLGRMSDAELVRVIVDVVKARGLTRLLEPPAVVSDGSPAS